MRDGITPATLPLMAETPAAAEAEQAPGVIVMQSAKGPITLHTEQPRVIQSVRGPIALPCLNPQVVPIEKVRANTWNPNAVAEHNMQLLLESILSNGFCFPVVTVYDPDDDLLEVVDGFHRYLIFRDYLQAEELVVVVLQQSIAQRMEATVQFNRARGVHQVELMADLVRALVAQGVEDEEIARSLGMEPEEVFRLKQLTGIADLFRNQIYSHAWEMVEVDDAGDEEGSANGNHEGD